MPEHTLDEQGREIAPQGSWTPEQETALSDKVAAGLASVFGDDEPNVPDDDDNTDNDSTDAIETIEDETSDVEEAEEVTEEDEAEEAAAEGTTEDPNAPTLPDAYRRSLKAYDWTDEDIDHNLKLMGPQFISTAARLHANRNAELANFAAIGRQARQAPESQAPAPQAPSNLPLQLPLVDAEKMKEKYGDDAMVDELVTQVNASLSAVQAVLPQLRQGQQAAEDAEFTRLQGETETFFGSEALKPYTEFYGSSDKGLTRQNVDARNNLLDTAFALMSGVKIARNQNLSLTQALEQANEIVSRDFKKTAVRTGIQKQAKARSKGLTFKPTSGKNPGALERKGPPRNQSDLEARTSQRLRALFG